MEFLNERARCVRLSHASSELVFVDVSLTDDKIEELYNEYFEEVLENENISTSLDEFLSFIDDKHKHKKVFFFCEMVIEESEITL